MNAFELIDIAFTALEERKNSPGPQQPMCRYPDLVEGPSPTADIGTADVSDSDYDGAPWCTGCRARTPAGCKCGPIAEND